MTDSVSGSQDKPPAYHGQYKMPASFDAYYKKHFPTATPKERQQLFDGFMQLYMNDFTKILNDAVQKQKEEDERQKENQS